MGPIPTKRFSSLRRPTAVEVRSVERLLLLLLLVILISNSLGRLRLGLRLRLGFGLRHCWTGPLIQRQ